MFHTDPHLRTVRRFDERFAGPYPGWTNGGYLAGVLATHLTRDGTGTTEVRIKRPVPLETDLELTVDGSGAVLHDHARALARAWGVPGAPSATEPVPIAAATALAPAIDPKDHPAPGCFVCGPGRSGGLDLQPGPVRGRDVVATVWRPPADLADDRGVMPVEIVWAALDCPAWYGAARGRGALLGTMRARCIRPLLAETPVVVTGWGNGRDGRKQAAGAAIHSRDGEPLAVASSIWLYAKGS
jgi:hypothetical protein